GQAHGHSADRRDRATRDARITKVDGRDNHRGRPVPAAALRAPRRAASSGYGPRGAAAIAGPAQTAPPADPRLAQGASSETPSSVRTAHSRTKGTSPTDRDLDRSPGI